MTITEAIRNATSATYMDGSTVYTYSNERGSYVQIGGGDYWSARSMMTRLRHADALTQLGWDADDAEFEAEMAEGTGNLRVRVNNSLRENK